MTKSHIHLLKESVFFLSFYMHSSEALESLLTVYEESKRQHKTLKREKVTNNVLQKKKIGEYFPTREH